jgi:hypothetical protein
LGLNREEEDRKMTKKHRHLIATLGLAALAAVCFGLLTWALIEGAVVQTEEGKGAGGAGALRGASIGSGRSIVYTREDNPGVYWRDVGLLAFFGTLFAVVAFLERRTYLTSGVSRKSADPASPNLLAKIDRACELYPEGREALLRAKTALLELNSPEVEAPLDNLLEKVLKAPDREAAVKEIKGLAKAMDLFGKL